MVEEDISPASAQSRILIRYIFVVGVGLLEPRPEHTEGLQAHCHCFDAPSKPGTSDNKCVNCRVDLPLYLTSNVLHLASYSTVGAGKQPHQRNKVAFVEKLGSMQISEYFSEPKVESYKRRNKHIDYSSSEFYGHYCPQLTKSSLVPLLRTQFFPLEIQATRW